MLAAPILQACTQAIGSPVERSRPVSGGSINAAYRLETSKGYFFLKVNDAPQAGAMMAADAYGLRLLGQGGPLRVPEVIRQGTVEGQSYLLLAFIEEGRATAAFWQAFGEGLARLHQHTAGTFGLDQDNFIGSLPQRNHRHSNWADFYREERLRPQVSRAIQQHLLWPGAEAQFDRLYERLPGLCPAEPPALTHGDLWSGNFLTAADGTPVLIDPAVSYAHREMDLGMSLLFGGFAPAFYEAYEQAYPTAPGFRERAGLYQLYYLLVHVNLFGRSYTGSVQEIVNRWAR
ncbi:MAG: fructosamine kinase family protein [bacterium]|nr:fructosamine kinase family protein [bacterium]